jgi:hypothetical protein
MSAYLERLVNRLIQPEAEIQPRLPGLFEPGPLRAEATGLQAGAPISAPGTEKAPGEAEEVGYPIEAEPLSDDLPKRLISATQFSPTVQAEPQPLQPVQPATPESQDLSARQPPQWFAREAYAAPFVVPEFHALPAAPPIESFVRETPKEAARKDVPNAPGTPAEGRAGLPAAIRSHPADIKEVHHLEGNSVERLPAPARPILTRLASAEDSASEAAIAQVQPIQAGTSVAPQIRVTIGRIEVRAANPPPAAPRKAAARQGPVVSLEDYLKRRQGGSR